MTLFEDDLRKEYPVTAELLTERILDVSLKGNDIRMNLRTIKTRLLNAKNQIISENFYFMPSSNSGAYIKTQNIDLIKLLAISAAFKIEITQIISRRYNSDSRSINYELYKLCWPFVILCDSRPANLIEYGIFNSISGEITKYRINNHLEFIVDAKDDEITHITFQTNTYAFNDKVLTKVYDFIEQCKKFIG